MAKRYLFPEVISITLYKYNSLDSKLYTLILDNCKLKKYQDTILVRRADVKSLLQTYFKNELNKVPLIPVETLHKEANSIYFLKKILDEMPNLRWLQIQYSKNLKFTRIVADGDTGGKTLNFVFKAVRGSFRTFDFFKEKEMDFVNYVLKEVGCIKELNYSLIKLKALTNRLEKLQQSEDENIKNVCDRMIKEFDLWYDDDPEALIITDYLEDI
tara:strand:- start:1140 stop:1781 length:642 start_codon:yes stop_codon:yes gene_type:complete